MTARYGENSRDWRPYFGQEGVDERDASTPISVEVQRIASDTQFRCHSDFIDPDGDVIAEVERAADANCIVVIVLDAWTLELGIYSSVLRKLDGQAFKKNYVVLVPHAVADAQPPYVQRLKDTVGQHFEEWAFEPKTLTFERGLDSPAAFRRRLRASLQAARERVIDSHKKQLNRTLRQSSYLTLPSALERTGSE